MKSTVTVLTNGLIGLAAFFATSIPLSAQAATVIVDGQYDEWDLANDFFAPMHEAGQRDKDHLSDAYLRYDSNSRTLFVLVLEAEGATTPIAASEPWAKIYSIAQKNSC